MTPEHFRTADFQYELPPELIAQHPLPRRDESRLLIVRRQGSEGSTLDDSHFAALADLIPAGDLVVLNTTRVRHARLIGTRPTGAPAEILLIRPGVGDTWLAMGKPGSALRPGKQIELGPGALVETLELCADGNRIVRFVGIRPEEAIQRYGRMPLPPYIEHAANQEDELRYQTVYADREGSVAAPTAGLHFTSALLDRLRSGGVLIGGLDLEVGPGTFKPVEVEDPTRHEMHPERYEIPTGLSQSIAQVRREGRKVWAVGTTVVRALESSATADGSVEAGLRETRLLITPGFTFRVVDRLITNFHLPRSTLLMLVSAFAGYDLTMTAYRHAVSARYRFYSYGDAMVII